MFFDPLYFILLAPALLLGVWAQFRVRSTYFAASQEPARLSGAAAARYLLDSAGLQNVAIEPVAGELTDHYDPRDKVLRLSQGVYSQRTMAAVGIAAHEAGHAIQDAVGYAPLALRNLAVPVANLGSASGMLMIFLGSLLASQGVQLGLTMIMLGILGFTAVAAFQLINLPVEFDASNRAKRQLVEHNIVGAAAMGPVNSVLNAAAWTYVAATLQAVLTLLYLLMRFGGAGQYDER